MQAQVAVSSITSSLTMLIEYEAWKQKQENDTNERKILRTAIS